MTLLCVPVFADTVEGLRRAMHRAVEAGAGLIELRLDLCGEIDPGDLWRLRENRWPAVPVVLTLRSAAEGGQWDGDDDVRVSRLVELGPMAEYLDVELELWRRSANIRQKIGLALQRAGSISQAGGVEEIAQARPRQLILSRHDLATRPATLQADLVAMLSVSECRVPKLAWRARTVRDNFEAFDLMRASPRPAIVVCLGEDGLASRVLARKFGAAATFVSLSPGRETAAGQLPIDQVRGLYRWDSIGASTQVYGVVGDPVAHSLGPRVHNACFQELGENAVYLPFRVDAGYEPFKAFMVEVMARPWMDFRGLSVTIPHKQNALRFLQQAGGSVDPAALRVGAVNTICLRPGGELEGHNTDWAAVLNSVCAGCSLGRDALRGRTAVVLGAGGAARAAVAALTDAGMHITVFNRTLSGATELADDFGCQAGSWEQRGEAGAWLLVNCTPVGMWPGGDESPMPRESLGRYGVVFDTVYRPATTRLLREASELGLGGIGGMAMFAAQAAQQLRLWTGRAVTPETILRVASDGPAP